MKKRLTRIWGIGLVAVMLITLLASAAPISAGTLGFSATTDIPDATNKMIIGSSSQIMDIAVATGGQRIYTAVKTQKHETATATLTTALTGCADTVAEIWAVTYTDQDGNAGNLGSITFADNDLITTTATLALATGDTGVQAITVIAVTTSDATGGVISIAGDTSGAILGTWTVTGAGTGTPAYPAVTPADTNSAALYKSTDGGTSWSAITLPTALTGALNMVAVAPDDEDLVVIAGNLVSVANTNLKVYATTDAGSNWNDLGTVKSATGVNASQLNDLAISSASSSKHYVALAGRSTAGPGAYYFNMGATAPIWENACITGDFTAGYANAAAAAEEFFAVAFSPNFASDMVMLIVGDSQTAANDPIRLHIASFNQEAWDATVFTSYPATVKATSTAAATLTITKADISVDPEYLGGDDTSRIAFIGLTYVDSITGTEIGDIFRMKDYTSKDLGTDVQINSVAWDGSNLAAGAYLDNNVYRCADALVTTPTVDASRGYKEIGVDDTSPANDQVIVRWSGSTLVGGKQGAAAGFSRSTDKGKIWNDITLIESALTNMRDVWVSPDGSIVYLLTDDGAEVSLFRKADSAWSRVFCLADTTSTGYIVRAADADPDVVYIAERLTNNMYYSTDGGLFKWTVRASRYTIQDVAVQDADVAYVAQSANSKVSKTTNGGFTWDTTVSTSLGAGNIHSMTLVGADNLLVGSTAGYVSYTTDGNATWNDLSDKMLNQGLLVQVTASGLATGDFIFASTTTAAALDADVERWQIGTSTDWKDMNDTMSTAVTAGTGSDDLGCFGIAYQSGTLYILASDGTDSAIFRDANTETATPAATDFTVAYELLDTFNNAPTALRLNSGSALLWAIENTAEELHTFTDSLVGVPPVLLTPAVGFQSAVNPVNGNSMDIAFKWEKPIADTAGYELKISTDEAGDFAITTHTVATSESGTKTVLVGPNQTAGATNNVQFSPGQTYYWTVRVSTPAIGPWAAAQSFSIAPLAAQVPQILSPAIGAQGATTRPSFSWAPVASATNYQFQLALNPYMTAPIVDVNIASTAYRLLSELERGNTYYWRVQATAPVTGQWSAVSNFVVAEEPAEAAPPVVIEMLPAPIINIPAAPAQIQPADIIIPQPVVLPAPIAPVYIWAIIIIGAVLVIAVVVLIWRSRRAV